MSTPGIVAVSTARYVEARTATPTATPTASAATWRGSPMPLPRSFPVLSEQSFIVKANGRFPVFQDSVPRVGSTRGTLDCWFKMGSGADSLVLAQSVYASTTAPLITVGVSATGRATGSIQDAAGTTVAAWTAATLAANAQGSFVHMQVAWDALVAISGLYHVKVIVNDVVMPAADFTTPPLATWTAFQPTYVTTGLFTETAFDGEMILTQASLKVVI